MMCQHGYNLKKFYKNGQTREEPPHLKIKPQIICNFQTKIFVVNNWMRSYVTQNYILKTSVIKASRW